MPSSMDVFSKGKNDFFPANQCSWSGSFPPKKSWIRNTAANMILFFTECFALKVLLERLVGKLNITVITTDRSSSIKAAMRWGSLFYLLSFDVNMYFPPPLHMFTPVLRVRSSKKRTVCMQCFRKPYWCSYVRCRYSPVFRIHMFLFLPDPDPPVRGMDPDPSINMQK